MPGWSAPLDGSGQTLAFTGVWSAPLDGSGQTLEDVGNPQWSAPLDGSGQTLQDWNPVWSAPLDGSGQTLLGFGILSATDFRPGTTCTLTVAGVDAAYTLEVGGQAVSVSDSLDGNGDGTISFTAPRAVAYGTDVTLDLTMGVDTFSLDVPQLAETGLAFVNLGPVVPQHVAGLAVQIGDTVFTPTAGVRGSGRRYVATTAGTTGATAPTHGPTSGAVSDGGVSWAFDAEWGRITATPDLEEGFQLAAYGVTGGTISDVTLFEDGTFQQTEGVTSFQAIAFDGTSWGAPGAQQEPQSEAGTASAGVVFSSLDASGEKTGIGTATAAVVFSGTATGFPAGIASATATVLFGATVSGFKTASGAVTAETTMISSASGWTARAGSVTAGVAFGATAGGFQGSAGSAVRRISIRGLYKRRIVI